MKTSVEKSFFDGIRKTTGVTDDLCHSFKLGSEMRRYSCGYIAWKGGICEDGLLHNVRHHRDDRSRDFSRRVASEVGCHGVRESGNVVIGIHGQAFCQIGK